MQAGFARQVALEFIEGPKNLIILTEPPQVNLT